MRSDARKRLAEPVTAEDLNARLHAAEAVVQRVEVLRDRWARLATEAIDPECREWTSAASRSLDAAINPKKDTQ